MTFMPPLTKTKEKFIIFDKIWSFWPWWASERALKFFEAVSCEAIGCSKVEKSKTVHCGTPLRPQHEVAYGVNFCAWYLNSLHNYKGKKKIMNENKSSVFKSTVKASNQWVKLTTLNSLRNEHARFKVLRLFTIFANFQPARYILHT